VSIRHMSYLRLVSSVARLGHRDYDGALAFVSEAAASNGSQPFELHVIEQLLRLIPADRAGYFEYHAGGIAHGETTSVLVETPGEAAPIEWSEAVSAIGDTWPLADTSHEHSAPATALFLSDFLTGRARPRNPWYALVLRPRNIEHECKLWLGCSPWAARGFFLVRERGSVDFDERDRTLLSLLRPHLTTVRERWERRLRPAVLSDREAEVLALAAEGLTNTQIAARLVIAPTTVRTHLENIFEKLGVRTRTAAAAWLSDCRRATQ
jgi:DNA-binding CsgD family transcriptional regulator